MDTSSSMIPYDRSLVLCKAEGKIILVDGLKNIISGTKTNNKDGTIHFPVILFSQENLKVIVN